MFVQRNKMYLSGNNETTKKHIDVKNSAPRVGFH